MGQCAKIEDHLHWIIDPELHSFNTLFPLSRKWTGKKGLAVETDRNSVSVAVSAPKLTSNAVSVWFRL